MGTSPLVNLGLPMALRDEVLEVKDMVLSKMVHYLIGRENYGRGCDRDGAVGAEGGLRGWRVGVGDLGVLFYKAIFVNKCPFKQSVINLRHCYVDIVSSSIGLCLMSK